MRKNRLNSIYFQEDRATRHYVHITRNSVNKIFCIKIKELSSSCSPNYQLYRPSTRWLAFTTFVCFFFHSIIPLITCLLSGYNAHRNYILSTCTTIYHFVFSSEIIIGYFVSSSDSKAPLIFGLLYRLQKFLLHVL